MPKRNTEAVVIGGGPAGAAAAIILAETGVDVLVLEAETGPRAKVGESLPPNANPILLRLGLTGGIGRAALPSQANRSRWGSSELVEREFFFGSAGVGWRLDRMRFEAELATAAVEAGVDWRYGHRLIAATSGRTTLVDTGDWSLTVESANGRQQVAARMVIDASGRAARFARSVGVRRVRYDRLVGVVSYSESMRQRSGPNPAPDADASFVVEDSSLVIEAVPTGWWYSLWLPGSKLVIAYLTDGDLLRQSGLPLNRGPSHWLHPDSAAAGLLAYAPTTRDRIQLVGVDADWSRPQIRPAHTERSAAVTGLGWLAVGEAATCYDPLSSYGITSALGAGIYAGTAAAAQLAGRADALVAYARLIDETFAKYLLMCHERYATEQRWPAAAFWRRRQRAADLKPGRTVPGRTEPGRADGLLSS